jgi:hypothetical protein
MSLALNLRTRALERRRHQRVRVVLLGRFMLENHQEYPCQSMNISPGGIALLAPVQGHVGERVVIYLEHLGRLEGTIVRHFDLGFAVSMSATRRKQDKLADQLTWLANRHELGLPEDRRHERITPRSASTVVRLMNGKTAAARIIDISMSGAAINVGIPIAIGASITLGSTPGRVVRHFGSGIGIEFLRPLTEDVFDEDIVL